MSLKQSDIIILVNFIIPLSDIILTFTFSSVSSKIVTMFVPSVALWTFMNINTRITVCFAVTETNFFTVAQQPFCLKALLW